MIRSGAFVFALILLLSLVLFRESAFSDPGTLWHTVLGNKIIDSGRLPQTDPFTFPFADFKWVSKDWLAEIGMAIVYRISGFDGLLLVMSALLATLHSWIYSRLCLAGIPAVIAGALSVLAWFFCAFHDLIRPHLLSLAFIAWTTIQLIEFDRGRNGIRRMFFFVPVFALWTNLHPGVIGGILMVGSAIFVWSILFLFNRMSPIRSPRDMLNCFLLFCGCLFSTLINPYGIDLHRLWWRILSSHSLKKYFAEHQPLDPFDWSGQAVLIAFAAYFILSLTAKWQHWRITWLIPIAWFLLSLKGIRQGPLCVLTCLILTADIWPYSAFGKLLTTISIPKRSAWNFVMSVTLVAVIFLLQRFHCPLPVVGEGCARLNERQWPLSLTPVIRSIVQRVPADTPIYNDIFLGGYLIWNAPELKIFCDDRFELWGDNWLNEYMNAVEKYPERFDDWQKKYGFRFAVVLTGPQPSPLEKYLLAKPTQWKEIGRHPVAVIFEMTNP